MVLPKLQPTAGQNDTHFSFVIHVQCPALLPRLSSFVLPDKKIVTRQDGWFQSIIIKQSWDEAGSCEVARGDQGGRHCQEAPSTPFQAAKQSSAKGSEHCRHLIWLWNISRGKSVTWSSTTVPYQLQSFSTVQRLYHNILVLTKNLSLASGEIVLISPPRLSASSTMCTSSWVHCPVLPHLTPGNTALLYRLLT